jgi:hypothetical protein
MRKGWDADFSAFSDMLPGGGMVSNVDNEVEILNRTLIENTVKKLNLNIRYFVKEHRDNEIYSNSPIEVYFNETVRDERWARF